MGRACPESEAEGMPMPLLAEPASGSAAACWVTNIEGLAKSLADVDLQPDAKQRAFTLVQQPNPLQRRPKEQNSDR